MKAEKTPILKPNLALKLAIVGSGKKQNRIAERAFILPVQLSKIVTGRLQPTPEERRELARVLRKSQDELFGAADGGAL